jgi:hypothetical protein
MHVKRRLARDGHPSSETIPDPEKKTNQAPGKRLIYSTNFQFSCLISNLRYFRPTCGIFPLWGPKFSLLDHPSQSVAPSTRIFQRLLSLADRFKVYRIISPWPYEDTMPKESSCSARFTHSSPTSLVSSLYQSMKWPEVGP